MLWRFGTFQSPYFRYRQQQHLGGATAALPVPAKGGLEDLLKRDGQLGRVRANMPAPRRKVGVYARRLVLVGRNEDGIGTDRCVRGEDT
eukprot:scaffold21250_cov111-Isochrysis_galbana.AAC.6